ncbi:cytochrome c551 [Sinobaca qinghaiensis]|uniref:Cytochrome c551 n=1 Tax=Sinobaca qinghaiensis TaxID=342944 RepID=A0A419V8W2_9BACL|nr:cytochrome c [Sinobaca qinghaiensis]RKD76541.1 cytochrome c551 [Sinobaca qinghaiensis]
MKKALLAVAGSSMFMLAACGGGGGGEEEDTTAAPEQLYQQNCATCHGENLEGNNGPALDGGNLEEDQVLTMIENGGNGMPAGLLEGTEAESVATWVAEQ